MKKFLSSKPLQIAQLLTTRIQKGEWTTALPSERVLAEEYLVSRTSIRSALDILEEKNIISPPESTRRQTSSSSATSTPQMPPAKTGPSGPVSMAEKLGPLNASSSPAPAATPPSSLAAPAPPQRASSTSTGRTSPANHLRKISSPTSPKTSQKLNQAPSLEVHLPLRYQDLHLDREIGSCQSGTLFTNLQNAD